MTDTDIDWWPEGYRHPAFEVKRRRVGSETKGGDYTRGSAGYHADGDDSSPTSTLPYTALRFPTRALDPAAFDLSARGLLFAQAFDYDTIKLVFHFPTSVYDTFKEMAIVRSSFGKPIEPMQGVTIMRRKREDFVEVEGKLIPPVIYDEFVAPQVPDKSMPGQFIDGVIPNGRWYYYTAFFNTNGYDWAPMMSDQCLLPRDYGHAEHLWNAVPPYYQWVDANYNAKNFLQRFLSIFGFEMDRTREYVESLLKLHNVDESPMMLLRQLGNNYGLEGQEGLGDIRYRALMANWSHMMTTRGTAKGLLELIETASKYDADVTQGANNVLTPDDSNFVNSTGHWAPLHPSIPFTIPGPPVVTWLPWDQVRLTVNPPTDPYPPTAQAPGAAGSMGIYSADPSFGNIFICAGAGKWKDLDGVAPLEADKEFIPYYHGLPVNPSQNYGFSVWIKSIGNVQVFAYLLPFTSRGKIVDMCQWDDPSTPDHLLTYRSFVGAAAVRPANNPPTSVPTDWFQAEVIATLPDDCEYVVPGLLFKGRDRPGEISIGAAMVYSIEGQGSAKITPSDRYLILGAPAEFIGASRESPPYEGYWIGKPN